MIRFSVGLLVCWSVGRSVGLLVSRLVGVWQPSAAAAGAYLCCASVARTSSDGRANAAVLIAATSVV